MAALQPPCWPSSSTRPRSRGLQDCPLRHGRTFQGGLFPLSVGRNLTEIYCSSDRHRPLRGKTLSLVIHEIFPVMDHSPNFFIPTSSLPYEKEVYSTCTSLNLWAAWPTSSGIPRTVPGSKVVCNTLEVTQYIYLNHNSVPCSLLSVYDELNRMTERERREGFEWGQN